jgi:filamentous hemagglutinin
MVSAQVSSDADTPTPYVPTSPGSITATGTILNDGGKIHAGGSMVAILAEKYL